MINEQNKLVIKRIRSSISTSVIATDTALSRKFKNTKRIRLRMILSYILVTIACTATMALPTYSFISGRMTSQAAESNSKLLDQLKSTIDSYIIDNTNKLSINILRDPSGENDLMYFFNHPVMDNMVGVRKTYENLKYLKALNPALDSISVYYKRNNLIISSEGMKLLNNNTSPDWIDTGWITQLNESGKSNLWFENRKIRDPYIPKSKDSGSEIQKKVMTMARTFPLSSSPGSMKGAIAISINEKVFHETVSHSNRNDFERFICINGNGTVISDNQEKLLATNIKEQSYGPKLVSLNKRNGYFIDDNGKDKLLISFSSSDYNGWRYIAIKPLSKIPSGLQFFSRILLGVALATLIIGLILSFLSAKKFYLPLKKLVDICKNSSIYENSVNENPVNEYELINCTMNSLVYRLKAQNKKLEDNFPIIKHHFIIDLINSHFINEDDIFSKMNLLNIDLKFPYFLCIIIKPGNMNTLLDHRAYEYSKINLMEAAESLLLEKGINCICTEHNKNIICILNLEHPDINITHKLEEMYMELVELSQLRIQIGTGSICGDILQIANTYITASNCIKYTYIYPEHAIFTPEEILQWEYNTNTSTARRILQQFDSDLHEQDKNKMRLRVHELVNLIREEHYSYSCTLKLLAGIPGIIENYLDELKINTSGFEEEDIASVLIKAGNILQYQTQLDSLLKNITLLINEKHDEKNKELVKKVKKYISENISRGNISLENVASAMYISPSYLSRIFRNEAGINFIDYVMDMKLDWSKELLLTGSKKIEDISMIIGYSNPQYFIKKFKLKYGITPKNYLRSQ